MFHAKSGVALTSEQQENACRHRFKSRLKLVGWLVWFNVAFNVFFSFSHMTTVSGCERELNAHFYSTASLKYHAMIPDHSQYPDTGLISLNSAM